MFSYDSKGYLANIYTKLKSQISSLLLKGVGTAFLGNVIGMAMAFLTQVILARLLGVDDYGRYTYVMAWLNFWLLFGVFGFDTLSFRYVSMYLEEKNYAMLKGFFKNAQQMVLFISISLSFLILLLLFLAKNFIDAQIFEAFLSLLLLFPINSAFILWIAVLQAFKEVFSVQIIQNFLRPVFLSIFVIICYLLQSRSISSSMVIIQNVFVALLSLLIIKYKIQAIIKKKIESYYEVQPKYERKAWLNVAFSLSLISIFQLIINQSDILLVGVMLSPQISGIYSVSNRLVSLMNLGITAVGFITAPIISEMYANKKTVELQKMAITSARASFFYALCCFLFFIFFGRIALSLFGEAFSAGYQILIILSATQVYTAFFGSLGFFLTMTAHQKEASYVVGLSAIEMIILLVVFINIWGTLGAAIACSVATITRCTALYFLVKKKLNIKPKAL